MSMLRLEGLADSKLITLVKSLQHVNQSPYLVFAPSEEGLKLSTDTLKMIQSHLYLPRTMFRNWVWRSATLETLQSSPQNLTEFAVTIQQFIQALEFCRPMTPFGKKGIDESEGQHLYKLEWSSSSDRVTLKTNDYVLKTQIDCSLAVLSPLPIPSLVFTDENNPVMLKVITNGEFAREWMVNMSDQLRITIEADPTIIILSISAEDQSGNTQITISTDSERIETFSCLGSVCHSYPTGFIHGALKGLTHASKVSLRINKTGTLSLQMMLPMTTETAFLEFVVAPFVD